MTLIMGLTLSACGGDDEPEVKFDDKSISYGQSYTIPNGSNVVWTSSNELVASVTGNTVTAKRVGEAIISSDKGSFKITVTPTSYVFTEPCLQWGTNKNNVKTYMNSVSSVSLKDDNSTTLSYTGTGKVVLYNYSFENNGLKSSGVGLNGDYVDAEAMSTFMIERYIPVKIDESDYSFYFISPDEKTGVLMQLTASGRTILYVVVYVPLDSSRSNVNLDELFKTYVNVPSEIASDTFLQLKARL